MLADIYNYISHYQIDFLFPMQIYHLLSLCFTLMLLSTVLKKIESKFISNRALEKSISPDKQVILKEVLIIDHIHLLEAPALSVRKHYLA